MKTNFEKEEQIKDRVIELFQKNKSLTDIKNEIENNYHCSVEFNMLARIIRLHLGTRHRLFARKVRQVE